MKGKSFARTMNALLFGMALALLASGQPALAQSSGQAPELDYVLGRPMTEEEIKEQQEIAEYYINNSTYMEVPNQLTDIKVSWDLDYIRANTPSSYDSRNVNGVSYVTPIRNQNPYGTCWVFSGMACVESNLLKKGYATEGLDLSESHLIYFSNYSAPDVLGNDYEDSVSYEGAIGYADQGGNVEQAFSTLLMWKGAVSEEYGPYEGVEEGFERTTEVAYLNDLYHLQGYYYVDMTDAESVKNAIMTYGAVQISYYSTTSSKYYNASTAAQYCNEEYGTNHGVAIVGWDDNYSRANFAIDPGADGAWLVKNSWGTRWGDSGYFWLSYEDATIRETAHACDVEPASNYDNNYQYDFTIFNGMTSAYGAASVFEAKANPGSKEVLEAVAINLGTPNVKYTIQVYTNLMDMEDPTSGTPMLSKPVTGETTYAGYYTIPIPEKVTLNDGEQFAVVFTLESANESEFGVMVGKEYSAPDGYGNWLIRINASSRENESYTSYSENASWYDIGASGNGNLCIKAYTSNTIGVVVPVIGVEISQETCALYFGEETTLTATVYPADATNKEVRWDSSNPNVATVSQDGKVTAVSAGTATISVVTLSGNYAATCEVTVKNYPVTGICLDKKELVVLDGSAEWLTATVFPENATNKTVVWSSSDETVVSIYGNGLICSEGIGTAVVTATTIDGNYTASCVVQVVPRVFSIYFNWESDFGYVGDVIELESLTITPEDISAEWITWTSDNPDVISVDENGTLTLKKEGYAQITATALSGASCSRTFVSMLPAGAYVGNINSELISFDLKQTDAGAYYLTGEIVVVEWVDGVSTVPEVAPVMTFKSTDGAEKIEVFVTPTGTNTYYFDRFIEGLAVGREYVFEIASGNELNYSEYRFMNVLLSTSPNMESSKDLGRIGDQEICYKQADNGELRLRRRRTEQYVGNINSELIKTELVKGVNGNYLSGQIVVVEWVDGESTVPTETPVMHFKSTDGTESLPVFITPTGTNTYYFDRSLGDMDTTKEYIFTIESGDALNTSPYRAMIVTTAAMTDKSGTLWESDTQYVMYRTDSNTAELRVYAVNK